MPQSAMTVRLDSQMKRRFDELCAQFGMSANTAINVFVNAVVRTQSIPFNISTEGAESSHPSTSTERLRGWYQQHLDSLDPARPEMTQEEINEEIRQARADHKARSVE